MRFLHAVLAPFHHRRGVTVAAIVTLGLGIGATTAIYAFVDALLLRPLPYPEPGRLVAAFETAPDQPRRAVAPANFLDWRRDLGQVAELAGYYTHARTIDPGTGAERLRASSVSANFFAVLGVHAAIGRAFQPAEDAEAGARRVVLSQEAWRTLFGAEPGIAGRSVRVDEVPHEVVGVMPEGFLAPEPADLWVLGNGGVPGLAGFPGDLSTERDIHYFRVVGRLAPGTTPEAVARRLEALSQRLSREHPASNRDLGAAVVPLRDALTGTQRRTTLILLGAVALVLLIATANTTNLLLASAAGRGQEFAVRAALGASRRQLVAQLAGEGLGIALAAGMLGTALAALVVWRVGAGTPLALPEIARAAVNARVLLAGVGLALVAGLAATLVPALRATSPEALGSLRGGRAVAGSRAGRLRGGLAVAQLAVSLTLLTGAGLLLKGYLVLSRVDPGFRAEGVTVLDLALSRAAYPEPGLVTGYQERVLAAARATPGVVAVAGVSHLPTGGTAMNRGFRIEGRPDPVRAVDQTVNYQVATPEYLGLMGIPVRAGRGLSEHDGDGAPLVAVVNEAAAARYWAGNSPLGARLGFGRPDGSTAWATVVGIVGDVRHLGLDADPEPEVYVPMAQDPSRGMTLVVRTAGGGGTVAGLREAIREVDPSQPVSAPRALAAQLSGSIARPRFLATLLAGFAALALVLAAIGLHGLLAQVVLGRTREIGVRLALGAEPRQVVALILGGAARLVGLGVAIGVAGALALTRALAGMLYGVSATDPLVHAGTALVLVVVGLGAAGIPARRAARLDPTRVLGRADG